MNFIPFYMLVLYLYFKKILLEKLFLKFMSTLMNFKWSLHAILKNGFHLFYKKLCPIDRKVKFNKMES